MSRWGPLAKPVSFSSTLVKLFRLLRSICKRVDTLACDPQLVDSVVKRDFGEQSSAVRRGDTQDWSSYRREKHNIEARSKTRAIRRDKLNRIREQESKQKHFHKWFTLFHEPFLAVMSHHFWICTIALSHLCCCFLLQNALSICFLVMSILIPLKLDGHISWSWSALLFPVWILLAIFWAAVVSIAVVNTFHHYWLFDTVQQSDWDGIFTSSSRELVRSGKVANVVAILLVLCINLQVVRTLCSQYVFRWPMLFFLFQIFLSLQFDGIISLPFWLTFLPFWLTFGLIFVAPFTGWVPAVDRVALFVSFWCFGLIWLLSFLILLTVFLDTNGSALTLELVFMPLWYGCVMDWFIIPT